MVNYVREMMLSGGVLLPTRGVIGKRIKKSYKLTVRQTRRKEGDNGFSIKGTV